MHHSPPDGAAHDPAPSPIEALTGPFYDHTGAAAALRITPNELTRLAETGQVLQLITGDGTRVYPTRQFTPDANTIPYLADVLAALTTGGADPWGRAMWLSSVADDEWDGMNAWQWLASGRDPTPVLAEARRDAARWAT